MIILKLEKELKEKAKEEYEGDFNFTYIRSKMFTNAYIYALENDLTLDYKDVYCTVNQAMSVFIRGIVKHER